MLNGVAFRYPEGCGSLVATPRPEFLTVDKFSFFTFTPTMFDVGLHKIHVTLENGDSPIKPELTLVFSPDLNCDPHKMLYNPAYC
jgi:hypothetical protein